MILTLDIPDTLAERLRAEAEAYGQDINNFAVAKLEQTLLNEGEEDAEEVDDDLIAALREGLADVDAGRTVSLEEMRQSALSALAAHRSKAGTVSAS
jgi:predicted transcriptional regulator